MKISVVTKDFFASIVKLFPEHSVELLPENSETWGKLDIDLLIFTGGEDINPSKYGQAPISGNSWYNNDRDSYELSVFRNIDRTLKPKKILGICRGLQLLNVGFKGTLVQDLRDRFGKSHPGVHPLTWKFPETEFAKTFGLVNSLHHQGLLTVGSLFITKILGTEPKTNLIEAILWNNKYLGVQFHPELMDDSFRKPFSSMMERWVSGSNDMFFPNSQDASNKNGKFVNSTFEALYQEYNIPQPASYPFGITTTENEES